MKEFLTTFHQKIWDTDLSEVPLPRRWFLGAYRIGYAVIRDLGQGHLNLQAMSLVYTTILSLVPLLAISFSVLKGFGVHNQIEPMLLGILEPLGDKKTEVTQTIIGFVDNLKVGVLGALGLGLLLYTVISLMSKIEKAFNYAWHVAQPRGFAQRFSDYLSVLMVGPVLIFASTGITASVRNASFTEQLLGIESIGPAMKLMGMTVPYLLIIAAFTFIYAFIPNTKVKLQSALVGAVMTGVTWKGLGWIFATFVAGSAKYTAIYSAFATIIVFMIWLYLGWLVLLLGASISFYHQNPDSMLIPRGPLSLSNRVREKAALTVLYLIGKQHYEGGKPLSLADLTRKLKVPSRVVERMLTALQDGGIVKQTSDKPPTYVPACPFEDTAVKTALDAVRGAWEHKNVTAAKIRSADEVDRVVDLIESAFEKSVGGLSLKDMVHPQTGKGKKS